MNEESRPDGEGEEHLTVLAEYTIELSFRARAESHLARIGYTLTLEDSRKGAIALVHRARGPGGREVAVKIYRKDTDPRLFDAEVLAYGAVGPSDAIASFIESDAVELDLGGGASRTLRFLVLEWGDQSLQDELKARGGRLKPEEAARTAIQIAAGLAHMHSRGYTHNDVKPANVVRFGDALKLIDLGVAASVRATDDAGTVGYEPSDRRERREESRFHQDIHALGATLYELLTGRVPRIRAGLRPPRPSRYMRPAPLDLRFALDAICLRCLHPDRAFRYDRVEQAMADLGSCLEGKPLAPMDEPLARRTMRVVRARRVLSTLAFVLVLASLGSAVGATRAHLRDAREEDRQREVARRRLAERVAVVTARLVGLRAELVRLGDRASGSLDEARNLLRLDRIRPTDLADRMKELSNAALLAKDATFRSRQGLQLCEGLPPGDMRSGIERSFRELNEVSAGIESQIGSSIEDLTLRYRLEEVRQTRSLSLALRGEQRDIIFNFENVADQYVAVFREELGFDPYSDSFELDDEVRKFSSRLGRSQYAVFLIDCTFTRAMSCATRPLELWRHQVAIERTRKVAEMIDDQDPWTLAFHRAFRPSPFDLLRLKAIYTDLAKSADLQCVPLPKLMIVAEVLWEHDLEATLEFLERIREVHLHDPWVSYLLAEVLRDRGRAEDLPRILTLRISAYEADVESPVYAFLVADSYHRLGDESMARKYYGLAAERRPELISRIPESVSPNFSVE